MKPNLNDAIPGAPNFKWGELIRSSTAYARGINNEPTDDDDWARLQFLAEHCLQPARDHFGVPLKINSGFRSAALNKAIGGSPTSFHSIGCAADITFVGQTEHTLFDLFKFFYDSGLYTELIAEELPNGWIHVAVMRGREHENQLKYKIVGQSVKRGSFKEIERLFG